MSNSRSYSDSGNTSHSLISVGIDIGTTSTHLVFSKLLLANEAGATHIPRLTIRERKVLYQSDIHLTPLNNDGTIDGGGVATLLRREYTNSGFTPEDIDCGAVIITGETALLRNAEQVLHEISSLAGEFVAASAGPELESVLAGRGSGAMQHSRENRNTICNIDIGGGTTNVAIFHNGVLLETACLRIGGRCFRFNKDGLHTGSSQSGSDLINLARCETHLDSHEEQKSRKQFNSLGIFAAKLIIDFVTDKNAVSGNSESNASKLHKFLMTKPLELNREIDEYWLSGGVAELVSTPGENPYIFEDFGWFLAHGLKQVLNEQNFNYRVAKNPVRATVLGAGSYSVQLSGNTVCISTASLPLKGVPILRPFQNHSTEGPPDAQTVSSAIKKATALIDADISGKLAAIVLTLKKAPRYAELKTWAEALADGLTDSELSSPYIFIVESDTAMALGQLLKGRLPNKEFVVLDGIDFTDGDYLDVGKPLANGTTIPVTVKSLIFANDNG